MTGRPLAILFVIHQFLPKHIAGSEVYTFWLAKTLQALGHRVAIYTTEAHGGQSTAIVRRREHDGLPVWEAVHNNAFADFERFSFDPQKEAQFQHVLLHERPDLVHIQHLHQHSLRYVDLAKDHGLRVVYTLHEFLLICARFGWLVRPGWQLCEGPEPVECGKCAATWLPAPSTPPPPGVDPYEAAITARLQAVRAMLAKVDLCISPSAFLRDRFVQTGFVAADRIIHSQNGMATASHHRVARRANTTGRLRIGFVGTIGEWKGVHLLIEACNGLPATAIECQIWGVLVYFPDYVERLRRLASGPHIALRGPFDNGQIGEILAGIDVLVVPSLWYENSPVTIQEANLAGVPVITTDRGGMAEHVLAGRNGLHFRLGDAADLRRTLQRLLDEPGLLASLKDFPPVKDITTDAADMIVRYRGLLAGASPVAGPA
ncbi:MAG: glycosyltransferase family 4 protein [Planctomycetes bacterium]|nr:glycosyltransferase family 4 protein [Planctomycetota bacterium]